MKPLFLSAVICILGTTAFAQDYQPYYRLKNEGDFLLFKKDTATFISKYREAFSIAEPFLFDQLRLADVYAQQKKWDESADLVEKILRKGYPLSALKSPLVFKSDAFMATPQYKQLETIEKECFAYFLQSIDFGLYQEIAYLTNTDAYLSREATNQIDTLWRTMRETVMLHNLYKLLELTRSKGFPGERKLGFYNSHISLIIMHNTIAPDFPREKPNQPVFVYLTPSAKDTIVVNELKAVLKPLVMKGELEPSGYISLFDPTVLFVTGAWHTQYYGQRINRATRAFFPIWDVANVDARREEIGLPCLYEYAIINGVSLPDDYPIPARYKDMQ